MIIFWNLIKIINKMIKCALKDFIMMIFRWIKIILYKKKNKKMKINCLMMICKKN
jgi:hypothetical protein